MSQRATTPAVAADAHLPSAYFQLDDEAKARGLFQILGEDGTVADAFHSGDPL